jgi:hypothetical protein
MCLTGLLDDRPIHHHPLRVAVVGHPVRRVDGNPWPRLVSGPVYGYADQVPEIRSGSYQATSFSLLASVKSITSTPPVLDAVSAPQSVAEGVEVLVQQLMRPGLEQDVA